MKSPAAAIDLGTNTARLLIGHVSDGKLQQICLKRVIVRLGGGFTRERGISDEACDRAIAALTDFAGEMRRYDVTTVRAVATSAVRDAINGPAFCKHVLETCGIRLEVIDGDTEGRLTLDGILLALDQTADRLVTFDIGGGSTEYTLTRDGSIVYATSLPLGVVRLTEGKGSSAAMAEKIDRELQLLKDELVARGLFAAATGALLVGTAGTVTTLAAISQQLGTYDYRLVNNYLLRRDEVSRIYTLLLPLSPEERLTVPGLEKGREDLIIAGTLLTLKTMSLLGVDRLKVSDYGLLEGVLLSIASSSTTP